MKIGSRVYWVTNKNPHNNTCIKHDLETDLCIIKLTIDGIKNTLEGVSFLFEDVTMDTFEIYIDLINIELFNEYDDALLRFSECLNNAHLMAEEFNKLIKKRKIM